MSFHAVTYRRFLEHWPRPTGFLTLAVALCLLASGSGAADDAGIKADVEAVYDGADYQTSLPSINEDMPQPDEAKASPEQPDERSNDYSWLDDAVVKVLKWLSIVAFAAAVLFVGGSAYRVWRKLRLRPRRTDLKGAGSDTGTGQGVTSPALMRLADAEALARDGAYAEAIHVLLLAVVDALRGRADQKVMPASTARELVHLVTLDDAARRDFAGLVDTSERGHFGGRPADKPAFDASHQRARRLVDMMAGT
jgi:hypothetical protein